MLATSWIALPEHNLNHDLDFILCHCIKVWRWGVDATIEHLHFLNNITSRITIPLASSDTNLQAFAIMMPLTNQPDGSPKTRRQAVNTPNASRIVPKPIPASQTEDPRTFHISQIKKRFTTQQFTAPDGATSLHFSLTPSDPDFPYELTQLECDLRVPQGYPDEKPTLVVRNKDIPRGFGINVERGWQGLVEERKGASLLALMNALDKNLERFLSEQKVETIKIVSYKDTRKFEAPVGKTEASTSQQGHESHTSPAATKATSKVPTTAFYRPEEAYTKDQIAEAKARRAQEVRQLEARMGRTPEYRRSADGIVYTLSIEPKRRSELPSGLRSVRTLHMIVPLLYPLQDLRIQLNEAEAADAEPVEDLFSEKAAEQKQMTLMSHMNYLAQNLHNLCKQAQTKAAKLAAEEAAAAAAIAREKELEAQEEDHAVKGADVPGRQIEGKGFVRIRPPEWDFCGDEEDSEESSGSGSEDAEASGGVGLEDNAGDEQHQPDEEQASMPGDTPEKGTMLSFPSIELHQIEILQVALLSISVKCDRCRTINEFAALKSVVEKASSCKKCATPMTARFRAQLIHAHSVRAGFLDLAGCKVADMLPSTFVPTCGRCSTSAPGIVSVRGESMTNVCRECHGKFTFKLPDVKFLLITPGSQAPPTMGPRRRVEKLGLHAGEALPDRGSCSHYKRSYRWFRFSCCERVHACDRCHDAAEDHEHEWASRMLCGWCSREQRYAPEACGFCGRSVIGKTGRGFWEGGKGTRNRNLMSRKDPRKYKRTAEEKKELERRVANVK